MRTRPPISERLYRLLLRFYPGEFRDDYEREMLQAFRDRRDQDRRQGGQLELWLQVLADAIVRAPAEHLDVLRQDVRYALRSLRRAPLFSLATIGTLALAVGAITAIFSVVHAVALRPLPFDRDGRLMRIWEENPALAISGFAVSLPNFVSWRERARTMELAAWMEASATLQGTADPVRVRSAAVSGPFFRLLGVTPVRGRVLAEQDEAPEAPAAAVISESLWRSHFGGDSSTTGREVTVGGTPHTIVGIIPEGSVPGGADLFTPLKIDQAQEDRSNHLAQVLGRLGQGVTMEQARGEMQAVARQLETEFPASNTGWSVSLSSMYDWIVPDNLRRALYLVLLAVCCVLLIACANIAGLMLARAAGRRRDVAVRLAIGAARRRLVRQVLTEGMLLTIAGGLAGVLLAHWTLPLLRTWLPDSLPRADQAAVNGTVLLFSLALCAVTGFVFATLPALAGSRADLVEALKDGGRSASGTTTRWRHLLASTQIALATVLLVAAGMLITSVRELQRVELGFDPEHLTTAMLGLPDDRYKDQDAKWAFYRRLLERLEGAPGVASVAMTSGAPFDGMNTGMPIEAAGPSRLDGEKLQAAWRMVSPGYFGALRIPLVRGELFSGNGQADAAAMIVSASMARRIWGTDDVIGRQIVAGPAGTFTIVGVVGDVRNLALAVEPDPTMYISTARFTWPTMTVVVRSDGPGVQPAGMIRSAVRALDPQLAIFNVQQTREQVERSASQPRLNAGLISLFAIVAALLAAIGIYGVLAFMVSQARHEVGIRLALGAARRSVIGLFLRRTAWLTGSGLLAGLAGAYAAGSALQSQLYGISAHDPLTFAAAALLIVLVVLAAALIPASRAATLDPLTALRD